MELRNDKRLTEPDAPRLAKAAQRSMDRIVDDISRARGAMERGLRAATERISETRDAHESHVRSMREAAAESRITAEDRVDLSEAGRRMTQPTAESEGADASRGSFVDGLRAAHRNGSLATRERVELAAERLLGA